MKNFTIIPNEVLGPSQLSIPARFLLLILLKHCGKDDYCYPSQRTLAESLNCSSRHVRNLLKELSEAKLIHPTRSGFNRPNTYKVTKYFTVTKDRNSASYQLGSQIPLHQGTALPPKNTYTKVKGKSMARNFQSLKDVLVKHKVITKKSPY